MVVSFRLGPARAGDLSGVESLKSRNTTAGSLQRAARRGCAARPFSASGSCGRFHVGLSFLRPGAAGCSWLLCGRCSFTSALEALTQPPLGELCAVPFALVGVQRAGRASLELLVDRGVVDAQAGRNIDRPISEQMPRLDLLPVLEGQVAVLSRQSHLRPMGL